MQGLQYPCIHYLLLELLLMEPEPDPRFGSYRFRFGVYKIPELNPKSSSGFRKIYPEPNWTGLWQHYLHACRPVIPAHPRASVCYLRSLEVQVLLPVIQTHAHHTLGSLALNTLHDRSSQGQIQLAWNQVGCRAISNSNNWFHWVDNGIHCTGHTASIQPWILTHKESVPSL